MPVNKKKSTVQKEGLEKIGRQKLKITNRDKIYFPDDEITKGMVIDYYQAIAAFILPYIKNRPQSLNRNPNGIKSAGFFHKDAGENGPSWLKTYVVHSESSNKMIDYIVCNDKETLAYLNNLGCIELNPWHSTVNNPDKPDYLIIDIDPSDRNTFDQVIKAAQAFRKIIESCGAKGYCKTSGASGLHIYIPLAGKYSYEEAKDFAHVLCMIVQDQLPEFTTLERNLSKRSKEKIYLDYLQNRKSQTISSVFSLRPRKGATVSMPLEWKEVKKGLTPLKFTLFNALKEIQKRKKLFTPVIGRGINLEKCLKKLQQLYKTGE